MFLGIRSLILGTRLFARPIARPCSVFYICKPVRGPSDHVKRMMATDSGKDNTVNDQFPVQETHDKLHEGSNVESKNPVAPDQHELSKSVTEKDGLDSGDRDTQDQEDVKVTNEGKETDDKMDDSKVPTPPSEPTAPSTVDANSDSGPMDTSSGVGAEKDEEEATVPAMKKALTVVEGSEPHVQTSHVPDLKKTQTEKAIRPNQSHFADLVKIQQCAQEWIDKPLEDKRMLYKCGRRYKTLKDIPTWASDERRGAHLKKSKSNKKKKIEPTVIPELCSKVSLWRGDITSLEVDAIVNAANSSLLGGGGVDGAIHSAAGSLLRKECATLGGCSTGDAKISAGYKLPAKYVIHTVGPVTLSPDRLESCYQRSLELVIEKKIRSVAFPCIATGIYGYPNEDAAHIALGTVRKWLEEHKNEVDRIIFCVFLETDLKIYTDLLPQYFPMDDSDSDSNLDANLDSTEKPSTTSSREDQDSDSNVEENLDSTEKPSATSSREDQDSDPNKDTKLDSATNSSQNDDKPETTPGESPQSGDGTHKGDGTRKKESACCSQ